MKAQIFDRKMLGKVALAALALGGFLLFAGASGANAVDDCHRPYSNWSCREARERREAAERAAYNRYEWRKHHHDRDDRYGWDRR